jgi:hypothetical protein
MARCCRMVLAGRQHYTAFLSQDLCLTKKKSPRVNRDRERVLAQYEAAAAVITESLLPALLGCQDMVPANPLAGGAAAGTSACAALLATVEERLAARADAADYAGEPRSRIVGVLCTIPTCRKQGV